MNLNSIMIGTEDPKGLASYYEKLFGTPGWSEGDWNGWQIGNGFLSVGPHSDVKGSNREPGRMMWNIETAEVKSEFDRLVAAGATVVQEPYQPDEVAEMWIATLSDPDGNYFQLMSPWEG